MYNSPKSLFLILLIFFSFPLVSGESCKSYETYSIISVLPGSGYAFIVVGHSEWVCEQIAGEGRLRRNNPDGDYNLFYLFNGSDLIFLGKNNPFLGEPSVIARVNGSFYIMQRTQLIVPYKNVTLTVNGEVRNFTITAEKTEMKVYRFDGCASLIWNCTRLEFQNGTEMLKCNESQILSYFSENPQRNLPGVRGRIEDGLIVFRLTSFTYKIPVISFNEYLSSLSENKTPKILSTLKALPLDRGILIYYPGNIEVKIGSSLSDLPLLFFYNGQSLNHLRMYMDNIHEPPKCGDSSDSFQGLDLSWHSPLFIGAILVLMLIYLKVRRNV
ncbi:hypothetical protein [Thermococcus sp.]